MLTDILAHHHHHHRVICSRKVHDSKTECNTWTGKGLLRTEGMTGDHVGSCRQGRIMVPPGPET